MNILEFNREKARLNANINNYKYSRRMDHPKAKQYVTELCLLYIKAGVEPRTTFGYYELWEALNSGSMMEEETVYAKTPKRETAKELLSKAEIKYITKFMSNPSYRMDNKIEILMNEFKVDEDTLHSWFMDLNISTVSSQFEKAKFHSLKPAQRYIISSAQTASAVYKPFFENMLAYAEFIGAEVGIIATRYKNPTSVHRIEGDVWDERVLPYLTAQRQNLHEGIVLLGDLKIQATATSPTTGLDSVEGSASCIIGSPAVEFRPIATLPEERQKFLMSTGSVTNPSFTDTKAGSVAAEFHRYGFIVVEIESDETVHFRNVVGESDGSFNDLVYRVEDSRIGTEDVGTMVWGDSHYAQKIQEVTDAFRGMCTDLGISKSILHDVWDSKNLNVHNFNNPVEQYRLLKDPKNSLQAEIDQLIEELFWFEDNMEETIVVRSNHDDMLDRAMYQGDWKKNLANAELFVQFLSLTLSGKAPKGIIPYIIEDYFDRVKALGVEDSYVQTGVQLALHGHKGASGSKGSLNQFAKLPIPNIIGHSHAPHIKGNTYQVGISCGMSHGYNQGLSKWAYAGVTLNNRGIRQLIVLNKDTLTYTTLY